LVYLAFFIHWRLWKCTPGAAAVLVDEFNAGT
jgi:hypothetical protein